MKEQAMNLLTAEKIVKNFGNKVLFDEISFGIHEGDKIGVIGVNGAGKSTLLKIIAGWDTPDSGNIVTANGLKIAYLPQNPFFEEGTTVLTQVFQGNDPVMALLREYEETVLSFEKKGGDKALEQKIAQLAERLEKAEAWGLESEAKTILTKLGITDFSQNVSELSGGQRKRVALAGALISPVDLLILDEPTNHIDNDTVEWLEAHLEKYTKALLMVTHDRYFLDRVANRTLELEKGKLYSYQANYSKFLEMKAEREDLEAAGERKRQNFLRTELEWVRRGAQARSTKQKARLQRFEEVSSKKVPEQHGNVEISAASSRLGKKTIEIEHISKSYGEKAYIKDFSYIILRNDRIGITGANGCGKSTLLKIITKELQPDSGSVTIGDTVKIGIFAQESRDMDEQKTLLEYIQDVAEYVPTADGRITASQMLEKFLFPVDVQRSPISILSGGEKRRLYLLKVLMDAPNILFLDEPTNDLDITTLAILENYLETFQGAVISVSHDRYFLDKMANRIFAFEGNGKIKQYEGGYTDYKETKARYEETSVSVEKQSSKEKPKDTKSRPITKMSYKDQREYDTIGDVISSLENEIENVTESMEQCGSDYVKLQELTERKQKLEEELEEKMDRWLILSELAERIEQNKKG